MFETIKRGSVGPSVALWQGVLGVMVDGVFGPLTEARTKAWQSERGLSVDGIVGHTTWLASGLVTDEPTPEVLKGVDLSAVQGVRPEKEWDLLAELGIEIAMMRAIVGNETWSDASAKANVERARARGIKVGCYVFAYPLPHLSPEKQVEDFIRRTEALVGTLDLPLAMDAEWPPREQREKDTSLSYPWQKWGCSAPQLRDWILRGLERGDALSGRRMMLYSFRYWLRCIEAFRIPELAKRPLWLADYGYSGKWPTPAQAAAIKGETPWTKPTVVQHDGDGGLKLPGSNMDADFNLFMGSRLQLQELCDARIAPPEAMPAPDTSIGFQVVHPLGYEPPSDDQIAAYRASRIDAALTV